MARADERAWQGLGNGALLDAAEKAGFDLLVTCDQNVRYQQDFTDRRLAVLILSSNHWPSLRPLATRECGRLRAVQVRRLDIEAL